VTFVEAIILACADLDSRLIKLLWRTRPQSTSATNAPRNSTIPPTIESVLGKASSVLTMVIPDGSHLCKIKFRRRVQTKHKCRVLTIRVVAYWLLASLRQRLFYEGSWRLGHLGEWGMRSSPCRCRGEDFGDPLDIDCSTTTSTEIVMKEGNAGYLMVS